MELLRWPLVPYKYAEYNAPVHKLKLRTLVSRKISS